MRYHDTHFHLDLVENPEKVADQIEKHQVYTIAVTNSPSVFFYTEKITAHKRFVRPALGLHPELAAARSNEVDQFIDLIDRTRYIGEIGLDNSNKTAQDYQIQKKVFEKLISACADRGDKILTIHSRRAAKDVLDILGDNFPGKVILHWYSDPMKHINIAVDRGYYFSVNYPMILSKNGKRIIDSIPLDRILVETDGPFTEMSKQVCTPIASPIITNQLAKYLAVQQDVNKVKEIIQKNFKTLLHSPQN